MEYLKNAYITAFFGVVGVLISVAGYKLFHSRVLGFAGVAVIALAIVLASYADYFLAAFGGLTATLQNSVEIVDDAVIRWAGDRYIAMSLLRIVPPEIYSDMSETEKATYQSRIASLLTSLKEPCLVGTVIAPADLKSVLDTVRTREAQIRNALAEAKHSGDEHRVKTLEDERKQIRSLIQRLEKEGAVAVLHIATVSAEGFTKELAIKSLRAKREYLENNIRSTLGAMFVSPLRGRMLYRVYQMLLAMPSQRDVVLSSGL